MAYRFKRNESVAAAVRRIASRELDSIVVQLQRPHGANRDEAIHEARKGVKKIRALLRLVRFGLGDSYRAESRTLREAGRQLSELRDLTAVIEILDKLQQERPDQLRRSAIEPIRRVLVKQKRRAQKNRNLPGLLRQIAVDLKSAGQRVKKWALSSDDFSAIEPGLKKTLRDGRKAFARASKRPRPDTYHEWRKRIKDHWYHTRLLENLWTDMMRGYETSLKDTESWLGDDHNLAILRERLVAEPEAFGSEKSIARVLRAIEKRQKELRKNAKALGGRIYGEKPRFFVKRMRRLWKEWRAEPKDLDDSA